MVLETERLILREFELADSESFYMLNSDSNVLAFTGDMPFSSILEAQNFIQNYQEYKRSGYGRWAVVLKTSNEFIGWCGLKFHLEQNYTDLGFRFFKKYWNQGFATEASMGVIEYASSKLGLNKLVARVDADNSSSIRVLEKLDFMFSDKFIFNGKRGMLYSRKLN